MTDAVVEIRTYRDTIVLTVPVSSVAGWSATG
jgi:hypothetical protein